MCVPLIVYALDERVGLPTNKSSTSPITGDSCRPLEEPLPLPAACKAIPQAIRGALQVMKKPCGVAKKLAKKPAGKKYKMTRALCL